jgi:hypothetical protein
MLRIAGLLRFALALANTPANAQTGATPAATSDNRESASPAPTRLNDCCSARKGKGGRIDCYDLGHISAAQSWVTNPVINIMRLYR